MFLAPRSGKKPRLYWLSLIKVSPVKHNVCVCVLTCALLDSVFLSRFISERYWRWRDDEEAMAAEGDLFLLPPPPPPLLGRRWGDWRWCDEEEDDDRAAMERALEIG